MIKGIDISCFQENVNYEKLKKDGIEFVIIRCGFGKNESQKDTMFEEHYRGLKKAGIKVGTYLYSYVTSEENAKLEAENCLKFIKGKQFDLPVFYDLEDKITQNLGKSKITKCAEIFCKEIEKAGYKAGVYANLYWFNNLINVNKLIKKKYKIWCAQYYIKYTGKFPIDYWQYSSVGKVAGIKGKVDMNYCYDDLINSQPVDNSVEKYKIGKAYKTKVDLNIREGAGIKFPIKKYKDITKDAQKHSYKQEYACLKKGTKITCLNVKEENKNIWLEIPSGWVCGNFEGKEFIK